MRLNKLYALKRQLTQPEIREALRIFNSGDTQDAMLNEIRHHADRALEALRKTRLGTEERDILLRMVRSIAEV
jgi:geranylgeranyl pyrophosphate synthase